jgi:hypothetical protein
LDYFDRLSFSKTSESERQDSKTIGSVIMQSQLFLSALGPTRADRFTLNSKQPKN